MNRFTVRVELHKAAEKKDYDTLHAAMEKAGFTRVITTGKGKKYHLPPGEYNLIGGHVRKAVLNMAKTAAATTGLKFAILVTESNGRLWEGLEEVKVPSRKS